MIDPPLSWPGRIQSRLRREAAFLPKRLVWITLLLLAVYFILLVRAEQKLRQSAPGFVEARLQSKLVADYAQAADPSAPLAPLRWELVRAILQDENPHLSETELKLLLQKSLAAATAPILQATPTPAPTTQMIVRADVVVNARLVLTVPGLLTERQASRGSGVPTTTTRLTAKVTPVVLAVQMTMPAVPNGSNNAALWLIDNQLSDLPTAHQSATPTALAIETVTAMESIVFATPLVVQPPYAGSIAIPMPPTAAENEALIAPAVVSLVPMTPTGTPTNVILTFPTPSQANGEIAPTATPSPTPFTLQATATTSLPTATWTPLPTNTPTATATLTPLPAVTATATTTPLAFALVQPTVTSAPTAPVPPIITTLPTIPPTPTVVTPPTATPTPSPTLSPTPTNLPVVERLIVWAENDKVFLQWTPPAGGIAGYNLYRGATANDPIDQPLNATLLVDPNYTDTAPSDGRYYFYRVTVLDQQGLEGPPSQTVAITVADRTPPQQPGVYSLQSAGNQIQLYWRANAEADLAGYNVYRSTTWNIDLSQGPISGPPLLTTTTYTDTVLLDGQHYFYVITAVDQVGNESAPSFPLQINVADLTPPTTPPLLIAETAEHAVSLSWQASPDADTAGYRLYRATALPVATTTPLHPQPLLTTPAYTDQTVEDDREYYYVVVAVDANNNASPPSAPVVVTIK